MKEQLLLYLHDLTKFDYIYFVAVFVIFILLILLVLLLRKKATLALSLLLIALLEISLAPTIGHSYFHTFLYKNSIELTKVKRLQFVKALVIEGKLTNESKFDFKSCRIEAKVLKETHNSFKNLVFRLKPITTQSIVVNDIPKGADVDFKFLIEPFNYSKDFNVSVSGTCK